ncbi:two-component regulator propeller domain-containing protein [Xanthomonas sp. MUS 060]|uniref:ligand-binding sensor domain-containing protein n=1 Tax=Xanthomonas sp. MUS 060 TaxID=1588031 RepID=UPI001F29CC9B|nr:two-component regulator propeller domain-containing protein [Xanthomonas sp. MUS 060]
MPSLTEREVLNRPVIARWTMEEGLPHNLVHGLVQDRDGMIWVATWEGVARFDGRIFTSFDRQNTPGMDLSNVFSVVAEPDGGVLVGTAYNGVFRYVAGRWRHLGDARAQQLRAKVILRDAGGAVWVGNEDGLFRIERDGRLVDVGNLAGMGNAHVVCLLQDGDGLLVGTSQGLFRLASATAPASRWGSTAMRTASIRNLARDRKGGLLVATDIGLLWRSDDGQVQWLQRGERVVSALQDQENQLWITMSNGQLLRRLPEGESEQILSISGVFSTTLIEDREGLIWAGSSDGLYRVAKGDAGGLTRRDGLGNNYVRVVRQSADGAIWIGHATGLDLWQHGRIRALRIGNQPGRDPAALALEPTKDGGMWVGTDSQGVLLLSADGAIRQRLGVEAGVPKTMVRAVSLDADGGLWIGSNDGLLYRKGAYRRAYGTADGLPGSHVQTLYRDRAGVLWVGTNQGIATISSDGALKGTPSGSGFQAQNVFDFLEDPDGTLWIATDHGLLRRSGGRFRLYDHRIGLPRDKLFRLIDDKHGNIWATSNLGVFRIPRADLTQLDAGKRTKLVIDVLDRSDGMPGSQVNGSSAPAGWRSHDGTLLIPTSEGLGLIDPTLPGLRSVRPPPLVIESLQVNGKPLALHRDYTLHGGVARLAIRYAGLSFRSPDKIRYRYRLYGSDRQWIDAGSSEEAIYTNLPPGDYRLWRCRRSSAHWIGRAASGLAASRSVCNCCRRSGSVGRSYCSHQ